MACEDDLGAMLHEILDGGYGSPDPGVVGDLQAVIERHVQIHADEHLLAL